MDQLLREDDSLSAIFFLGLPGTRSLGSDGPISGSTVTVGLDLFTWVARGEFLGVRCVRPGSHLVTWFIGACDDLPEVGMRTSRFIHIKNGETLGFTWDADSETLVPVDVPLLGQLKELRRRKQDMERLLPFPGSQNFGFAFRERRPSTKMLQEVHRRSTEWGKLACHIDRLVVLRLERDEGQRNSVFAMESECDGLLFTRIPSPTEGLFERSGSIITEVYRDKWNSLRAMWEKIENQCAKLGSLGNRRDLGMECLEHGQAQWLGELQAAYLSFLVGASAEGLENWRLMVLLVANSPSIFSRYPNFGIKFLVALCAQVEGMPEDFFQIGTFFVFCLMEIKLAVAEAMRDASELEQSVGDVIRPATIPYLYEKWTDLEKAALKHGLDIVNPEDDEPVIL